MQVKDLEKKAKWVRLEVLKSIEKSGKSHIGGTYSATDLLVALYYDKIIKYNINQPHSKNRDRFILSKGHACTALYAIFLDLGILDKKTYNSYGNNGGLGGQLETYLPMVDFNTGSIGHSVGVAAGMALGAKMNNKKFKAFTMIGDSELYEGSIWESIIFAGINKLNNLIVIIDRNRLMVTDIIDDDGLYKDMQTKIEKFGWNYYEFNGHNYSEIIETFKKVAKSDKPNLLIANTIKGKGVSFMENNVKWHNATPSDDELDLAKKELSRWRKKLQTFTLWI